MLDLFGTWFLCWQRSLCRFSKIDLLFLLSLSFSVWYMKEHCCKWDKQKNSKAAPTSNIYQRNFVRAKVSNVCRYVKAFQDKTRKLQCVHNGRKWENKLKSRVYGRTLLINKIERNVRMQVSWIAVALKMEKG